MQRAFDILFSLLGLLFLSPLLLPVATILRITGEGEVFYRQERVGRGGRRFKLIKFATMLKNSPLLGTGTVTVKDDPRILPFGHFLRKTKINELPQLLNILLNDMSVVGPRPQAPRCFDAFPPNVRETILQMKPGLSGIGPIVFRDEENLLANQTGSVEFYDQTIAPYKGRVEAWYRDHQTMFVYFTVIAITAWVVIFPRSQIVWRVFPDLPAPPAELATALGYPS